MFCFESYACIFILLGGCCLIKFPPHPIIFLLHGFSHIPTSMTSHIFILKGDNVHFLDF